ncbi:MAG: glycosyltransferase family 2 protein [Nitrospirota bacterium]|nr:glycosyltransferase family 2 protein [Nitrospirota bacterium]
MSSPEISVVITFFREGPLLRETVESALGQTASHVEVVLVDNNADPVTREIAKNFAARIPSSVRYVHEPLQGVAASKNRGLLESRGRFVAILDGDDLMDPERLRLQKEAFLENPGVSLVSTWYDRVSMDNKIEVRKDVSQTEPSIWYDTQEILKELFPCEEGSGNGETLHFPLISTAFFEKKTALAAGGFENRFNPRWFEDIEFFLRMYARGEFVKVPRSLVRYRISSPEAMEIKQRQMDWVGLCRQRDLFFRILWDRFGSQSEKTRKIFQRLAGLWLRYESLNFLRYRDGKELGVRMLTRSLRADVNSHNTWKLWAKTKLPQDLYPKLFWFGTFMEDPLPESATKELVDLLFFVEKVRTPSEG